MYIWVNGLNPCSSTIHNLQFGEVNIKRVLNYCDPQSVVNIVKTADFHIYVYLDTFITGDT